MNEAALNGAIGTIGVASIASLLLPDIDTIWDAAPSDSDKKQRLRTGETIYFLILISVGGLHSLKARSLFPLVFVVALGVIISLTYERALKRDDPPTRY